MSTYGEQLLAWLDEPLHQLKDDYRSDPERAWDLRVSEMWEQLGVTAGTDDPVVEEVVSLVGDLLHRVGEMTGDDRATYLEGTQLDSDVAERVELAVTRHGPQPADHPVATEPEQPAKEPAEVSEQIARELALPVLRELARTRPELLVRHSTDELLARLGQVIARRLAGR